MKQLSEAVRIVRDARQEERIRKDYLRAVLDEERAAPTDAEVIKNELMWMLTAAEKKQYVTDMDKSLALLLQMAQVAQMNLLKTQAAELKGD